MTRAEQVRALKRAAEIRKAAKRAMIEAENEGMRRVAAISVQTTARAAAMVRHLGTAQGARLLSAVDQLLAAAQAQTEDALLSAHDSIFDVSLGVNGEALGTFGTVSPRQVLELSRNFDADYRAELRSDDYNRWIRRVPALSLEPESALRDSLVTAIGEGRGLDQAVAKFLDASTYSQTFPTAGTIMRTDVVLTNLPIIEQRIAPLKRAIRVVRTELGRVDNVVGITFAESAGITRFVNYGVGDDRQSDICQEATRADPMTIAEWKSSGLLVAPRHPYCRCAMGGIPDEVRRNLPPPAIGDLGLVA